MCWQGEERCPGSDVSNPVNWWGSGWYQRTLAGNDSVRNCDEETGDSGQAGQGRRSQQVVALGQWLVEVSRSLLDPRDTVLQTLSKRRSLRLTNISQHTEAGLNPVCPENASGSESSVRRVSFSYFGAIGDGVTGGRDTRSSTLGWQPLSSAQRFDYFVHKVCLYQYD